VTRWLAGEKPDRDSPDWGMRKDLGDAFNNAMDFLRTRPLHIEGEGFLAVHAGIDPRVHKLHLQSAHDLMTIRVPHGMDVPWYEAYTDERLIVFGHWARKEAVIRPNAIGLDTGCVYGGKLTAMILPERRLVSVPAERSYAGNNGGA
jgi:serine/threonine protein phosphatase 1